MVLANFPIMYIPDPNKGKPLAFGQVYIGIPDLDPEIPTNQLPVYYVQEDGAEVEAFQPIELSAGGITVYNGAPVSIRVDYEYSLKILDKNGGQEYYFPSVQPSGSGGVVLDFVQDTKELGVGQTSVTFTGVATSSAAIYIAGEGVDRGRLFINDDYEVTGDTSIELVNSYPVGTAITAVSKEPTGVFLANVVNIDTVDIAANYTGLVVGDALNIKEYHSGTGGGGIWDVVLIADLPGGAVNGFNTVALVDDPTLAISLRYDTTLNIKQFGAVGDAVTDDTNTIEHVMKLQQYAKVKIPTGRFVVSRQITVNDKYMHIAGDGIRVSEFLYTGSDGLFRFTLSGAETGFYQITDMFFNASTASCGECVQIEATQASGVIGGVDSLHITDVICDATGDGYWTKGLHTINIGGVFVNSTSFRNNNNADAQNDTTTRGIHIENNNANINVIRALSMSNFYIQRFHRGIIASAVSTIESIYVNNGEIVGVPVGLYFTGGGSTNAVSFVSTHIDPVQFALYSDTTLGLMRLDSCDFRAGDNGSETGYSDYVGVRLFQGETVTITGCHFSGNNVLDPTKQSIGINLNKTIRAVVNSNTFRNFDQGILRPNNEEYRIGLNDFAFVDQEVDQNAPQNASGIIESKVGVYTGDLDDLTESILQGQTYSTLDTSATNGPPVTLTGSVCSTMVFDSNAAYQVVYQQISTDIYYRQKISGAWGSWVIK